MILCSLSVLDLIFWSFQVMSIFDSRCWGIFFLIRRFFLRILTIFFLFRFRLYLLFHPLLVYLLALPVSLFWKNFRCSTHCWFLFDLYYFVLPLVMFSHLYDFSIVIKIIFTFLYESAKIWFFQLFCYLSFHFCHKWFDYLLCCLISSLLYIW